MIMNYWIWPVTPENWEIVKSKKIWAVGKEIKTKNVSNGDVIVFYVKGSGAFRGSFQVVSDWYTSTDLIWPDDIQEKKYHYPFQCKLEQSEIGDSVFNELISSLSFVKNKNFPQLALQGHITGPGNHGQPIPESDYSQIISNMQEPINAIEKPSGGKREHEEVIDKLIEIGTSLGFEAHTDYDYTRVGKKAVLDLVWIAKVPNLVEVLYTFEVQSRGQIESLIYNLLQSMKNPNVKKVVAVSDQKQLETIKIMIEQSNHTQSEKERFIYLDTNDIDEFSKIVDGLNSFKKLLGLS